MNVQEILKNHLKSIGADGLCCDGCGCGVDDLFPCDKNPSECKPAKKGIAEESGEFYEAGDDIFIEMEETEMTDNVVTCAFCGKQYPTGTPVTKHALLTEHIFQCEKHPIQEIGKVLAEFMSLSWPPRKEEIEELRSGLTMMGVQMPDHADVARGINGLNQLEKFLPKETK